MLAVIPRKKAEQAGLEPQLATANGASVTDNEEKDYVPEINFLRNSRKLRSRLKSL